MSKYIGITIGPIFSTMEMTSSPAGLWISSYMFSHLANLICKGIAEKTDEENIISPYYSKNNAPAKDGVGRYHDHIILKNVNLSLTEVNEICSKAKMELAGLLGDNMTDFVDDYVRVSVFGFESGNKDPVSASKEQFDCVELAALIMPPLKENPLLSMFDSRESGTLEGRNNNIKNAKLVSENVDRDEWQLVNKKGSILTLEEISGFSGDNKLKVSDYYAIVRADGDGMGKILAGLKEDSKIRNFSEKCIKYCTDISKTVKEYGGVTIYAGGDDLLAIVPVYSGKDKNIFSMIREINGKFQGIFEQYKSYNNGKTPTVSFGVAVVYSRYPLYEALKLSADMLFGIAKNQGEEKNYTSIIFRKHSGQSEQLLIRNSSMNKIIDLLKYVYASGIKNEIFLSSINNKIRNFEKSFKFAFKQGKSVYDNLVNNTFDSTVQKDNWYVKKLAGFLWDIYSGEADVKVAKEYLSENIDEKIIAFDYVVRIIKFFGEKSGKE